MASKIKVNVHRLSAASRRSYSVRDYWTDQELKCRACHAVFTFRAEQQRDWYEREQKNLNEQPVLCSRCFLKQNQRRLLKSRMDYALRELKACPTQDAKLEAAETIILYFQREQHGDLELARHLLHELLQEHPNDRRTLKLSSLAEKLQQAHTLRGLSARRN
jgi:hypothetical protein